MWRAKFSGNMFEILLWCGGLNFLAICPSKNNNKNNKYLWEYRSTRIIYIKNLVPTCSYLWTYLRQVLPSYRNHLVDLNSVNIGFKYIKLLGIGTLVLSSLSKMLHFKFKDAEAAVLVPQQNRCPGELQIIPRKMPRRSFL